MENVYSGAIEKVRAVFGRYLQWVQFDLECRIERPDSKLRWVRARSYPVRNSSGDLVRHAGIAGDKIPLLSRITALADAYEVMSNGRPYKKAMKEAETVETALKINMPNEDQLLIETFCFST